MITVTLNSLTLSNALVNVQLYITGDPSSIQLENATAAATTTTTTATTTVSLSAVFLTLYRTVSLYVNCFGRTVLYMCIQYHINFRLICIA